MSDIWFWTLVFCRAVWPLVKVLLIIAGIVILVVLLKKLLTINGK